MSLHKVWNTQTVSILVTSSPDKLKLTTKMVFELH